MSADAQPAEVALTYPEPVSVAGRLVSPLLRW